MVLRDREGHPGTVAERTLAAFAASVAERMPTRAAEPSAFERLECASRVGKPSEAGADPGWNPEGWRETHAGTLHIVLPPGFAEESRGSTPAYRWAPPSGSADLQVFPVSSEAALVGNAKVSSSRSTQRTQGMVTIRVGERRDVPDVHVVSAYFTTGRSPAFAIVGTTTGTARRTMLFHTIHAAIASPTWSVQTR